MEFCILLGGFPDEDQMIIMYNLGLRIYWTLFVYDQPQIRIELQKSGICLVSLEVRINLVKILDKRDHFSFLTLLGLDGMIFVFWHWIMHFPLLEPVWYEGRWREGKGMKGGKKFKLDFFKKFKLDFKNLKI